MALLDRTRLADRGRRPLRPLRPLRNDRNDRHDRHDRLNGRGSLESGDPRGPKRATVAALVLACAALATVDATSGLGAVRGLVGDVVGPLETATSAVVRPVTDIPGWFRSQASLRRRISALQDGNSALERQLAENPFDRNRLAEYEGLAGSARALGYALVPAHVVGYGPAQSFTDTVTIDAGTRAGITPEMTVVNADGLVGRVTRVTATTATVLLIVDSDSTVGGRIASDMAAGFVSGSGSLDSGADLSLQLLDQTDVPDAGDPVVSWSGGKAPYVSGVPIGRVVRVYSNLQDSTKTVEVKPAVDFGALDIVGVVVPSGTRSDRTVIEADGSLG